MQFNTAGHNLMLDALSNLTVALFTGPDFTLNEVTGGTYARQSITFATAANSSRDSSSQPEFDIPAGTTVSHAALYAGTTRVAEGVLPAAESFNAAGRYTFSDADLSLTAA
jgi:hypothetical protein